MKFTSIPTLQPNPNKRVPLAAVVEFATDAPSRAIVEVAGADRAWRARQARRRATGTVCPWSASAPARPAR